MNKSADIGWTGIIILAIFAFAIATGISSCGMYINQHTVQFSILWWISIIILVPTAIALVAFVFPILIATGVFFLIIWCVIHIQGLFK